MEILLKKHKIPCEIVKRKRRTLEIQVQPDGSLRILTPKGLGKERLQRVLQEKEEWITKKVTEMKRKSPAAIPGFHHGEEHHVFGRIKPLCFNPLRDRKKLQIRLTGNGFVISGGDFTEEAVKKALEGWYRRQTEKRVRFFVKKYRNSLPRPGEIQVKTQKKRWGSCSHRGKVMFNWKLSMAPSWVLEYIVVHELAHLEEFNHSKNFWALVKKTYPPTEEARSWLKENQGKLLGFS